MHLSERENQVLLLVAAGYENKQVARQLGISRLTVRNYMLSICRKLGAVNRTHAVVVAIRAALILPDQIQPPPHTSTFVRID
jgi:DNA-binding CsgD family transcriptional regulator